LLPTVLLALRRDDISAERLLRQLRGLDPPVIGRIVDDCVVLDLRTVAEEDDERLTALLVQARQALDGGATTTS
jgi:seryl-tRNA(Sec) selenium transferase